ncbi:MAG: parallel beta-helix repeat protein [Glaciihabitans sp.]|nr:parallel beta-helix repeat protein [Glaciihabitans sp.]
MPVRAELSRRRLLIAVLLVAILPGLLACAAIAYSRPAAPPGPPAYNPVPLPLVDVDAAMLNRELQRSRKFTTIAATIAAPQFVDATFPEPLPTLLLPPREKPYDFAEVRELLPQAFETVGDAVLLRASIEIPAGAHLNIHSATTPNVYLLSEPGAFATIISRGGDVDIRGTAQTPVHLSSWDPAKGAADEETPDGRAFILNLGGRMDIANADIGYLGFGTGASSGLAWRGTDQVQGTQQVPRLNPSRGNVTDTVMHNNWFGAYTFEAQGMQWLRNTFEDNLGYGFDPHDLSNDFLVADNIARGNGRHGFIFSRGCDRNIMRDNIAYNNRGHGFMIDDGRSSDSSDAKARRLDSNDNQLLDNHAYNNDGSGIEVEGGTGTVISGNRLERNHVGIRVKNLASALVSGNTISDSALAGVDVLSGAGDVQITKNTVSGGWASVAIGESGAAQLTDNTLGGASTPLAIGGIAVRSDDVLTAVGRLFRWNPLLVLWAAILGVPILLGIARLALPRRQVPGGTIRDARFGSGHVPRSERSSARRMRVNRKLRERRRRAGVDDSERS